MDAGDGLHLAAVAIAQAAPVGGLHLRDIGAAVLGEGALVALGVRRPKNDAAYEATRDMLRSFYEPLLADRAARIDARTPLAMGDVIKAKTKLMRMAIPGKLLFLFRIRFGLYAVLKKLEAEVNWRALEAELL